MLLFAAYDNVLTDINFNSCFKCVFFSSGIETVVFSKAQSWIKTETDDVS